MEIVDDGLFHRAYRRMDRLMIALSVAGLIAAFLLAGVGGGVGFAIGAAFSIANFRWIKRFVEALGSRKPRAKWWQAVLFGLRYLIFGAFAYGIVKVFGINVLAVPIGLLVAAGAVVVEILYELIYARA